MFRKAIRYIVIKINSFLSSVSMINVEIVKDGVQKWLTKINPSESISYLFIRLKLVVPFNLES